MTLFSRACSPHPFQAQKGLWQARCTLPYGLAHHCLWHGYCSKCHPTSVMLHFKPDIYITSNYSSAVKPGGWMSSQKTTGEFRICRIRGFRRGLVSAFAYNEVTSLTYTHTYICTYIHPSLGQAELCQGDCGHPSEEALKNLTSSIQNWELCPNSCISY